MEYIHNGVPCKLSTQIVPFWGRSCGLAGEGVSFKHFAAQFAGELATAGAEEVLLHGLSGDT